MLKNTFLQLLGPQSLGLRGRPGLLELYHPIHSTSHMWLSNP